MRWFVFFLLILNGLIFVWFNFQQQYNVKDTSSANTQEPFDFSSVDSLRLLSELDSAALQQRDIRRVVKPVDVTPVNLSGQAIEDVAVANSAASEKPAVITCQIIGSYPEIISARQVRIGLEERGIESRVVQIAKKLPAVSWVYIPALKDRKEALSVLKSLQEKGVDSFLMSEEGEYQYAISLGFFSNAESAQKIVKERRAQGYNAQLTMRVRERQAYWVALEKPQSVLKINDSILSAIIDGSSDVKKQDFSCKELAQLQSFN